MPSVHTSITIAAPPAVVREVFLDWQNYAWSKASLNSILVKGEKAPADLTEGDGLIVKTPSMSFEPVVKVCTSLSLVLRVASVRSPVPAACSFVVDVITLLLPLVAALVFNSHRLSCMIAVLTAVDQHTHNLPMARLWAHGAVRRRS